MFNRAAAWLGSAMNGLCSLQCGRRLTRNDQNDVQSSLCIFKVGLVVSPAVRACIHRQNAVDTVTTIPSSANFTLQVFSELALETAFDCVVRDIVKAATYAIRTVPQDGQGSDDDSDDSSNETNVESSIQDVCCVLLTVRVDKLERK